MKNIFLLLGLLVAFAGFAQQQKKQVVLTLDDCINTALDKNLALKRAQNDALIAKAVQLQSIMSHLPNLNASVDYDWFIGTTFDQNAARQVSATTSSSNPNIASNITLFNGLSIYNTRKQRMSEYDAAIDGIENSKLQTRANVLASYLNVIMGEENIRISQDRVELLEAQLERAEKRESVGVGSMEDVFNFRSQLATERLNLQTLTNAYESSKLLLLQAMRLDVAEANYSVAPVEAEVELLDPVDPFNQVLSECMDEHPMLTGAQSQLLASKYQYRASIGNKLPSITALLVVGSNYSSNGAVNPELNAFEPEATFTQQMSYNQFEYFRVRMNIPIFNNLSAHSNTQVAKLNMVNSELALQDAKQQITNNVQQLYLDLVAAQTTFQSATENLNALQQSYDFMQKRYETGNTDFYTFLESLNNKNRAEQQLINAKYSMILRNRILNIYRGIE
ncbi:MAG: TolC family protein [Cyclobacteriaceae bacterium]